jgi:MFS-type transporter involved in bile tolerance (Atg22 family)
VNSDQRLAINSPIGRLLALRWSGQLTDGIFQSGLASFILFSPERQPNAVAAATAFAVVLLPYSLIGPFVGTILDRTSRQRILFFSNLSRSILLVFIALAIAAGATGVGLTLLVLIAFGINRLILAGLSAGLPLLVSKERLVSINALAVTGGTIFVVLGGGVGIGVRNALADFGANRADSIVISVASVTFLITSLLALRLKKSEIGPAPHEIKKSSLTQGLIEMRDGFSRLKQVPDALLGIVATALQRGGLTALTLMALLLQRNTFNPQDNPDEGLAGFALSIIIAGIGIMVGAIIAPFGVAKFGRHKWIRAMLFASAIAPIALALHQVEITLIITGFFTGAAGQGVKVTNDALVQSRIIDEYRGRVFAVYDVIVNGAIVSGALLAALLLPISGESRALPLLISLTYFFTAAFLLRTTRFFQSAPTQEARS